MTTKTKNFVSSFVFLLSAFFFIASSTLYKSEMVPPPNCYHCGTVAACEEGGQEYGWTNCDYFPNSSPPDNCRVHGSSACGQL